MSSSQVVIAVVILTLAIVLSIVLPLTMKSPVARTLQTHLSWQKVLRAEKTQHTVEVLPYTVACCFCIRDCGKYLKYIFNNVERLKKRFKKMYCIFVYDNCSDNSEELLQQYQNSHDNVILYHNVDNTSPTRPVRIANSRNLTLDFLYQLPDVIDYHFVVDADDVNADPWDIDVIVASIRDRSDWDCLTFNRPFYYDIWALLYDKYKHHCWGFGQQSPDVIGAMKHDIVTKLKAVPPDHLLDCYSAFCGFGIYRTHVFKGLRYDGLYANVREFFTDQERLDTLEHLKQQLPPSKAKTLQLDDGVQNIEQADHVYLHLSAIRDRNARIRISPQSLFYS